MAYIDTQHLGKCDTCRHHRGGGCNTFCDCGEEYSPDLSKIPTADVAEVVRCKNCNYSKKYNYLETIGKCMCERNYIRHGIYKKAAMIEVSKDDFCSFGIPKERGEEK